MLTSCESMHLYHCEMLMFLPENTKHQNQKRQIVANASQFVFVHSIELYFVVVVWFVCLVMTGIVDYGQVWLLLDGWIDRSVDGPVGCVKFEVDDDNDVLFDRFVWLILLLAAVCIDWLDGLEMEGGWLVGLLLMSFDDWEEGWVDFPLLFVETVVQFDELLSMIDESFDVCWFVWLICLLLFVGCCLFADWQDKTRQWEQIKYGNWIDSHLLLYR